MFFLSPSGAHPNRFKERRKPYAGAAQEGSCPPVTPHGTRSHKPHKNALDFTFYLLTQKSAPTSLEKSTLTKRRKLTDVNFNQEAKADGEVGADFSGEVDVDLGLHARGER